ncbi:uncharacterized protein LOC125017966 [Mugil cephalus]|uniref:uncharacterized protein LOC125017966 n=1 Tax=Mugil cephalus TaxID=48193 RepID=UPI001FB675ED|nr:uncharacterized protein LOC125017966 [Mugil cephalus]
MEQPPRPTMFDFHGVGMTKYFTDNWDNIQNFKARPDDILIVTYPKAGTTWVSYILDLLYFRQTNPDRQLTVPLNKRVPFLEMYKPPLPPGTVVADELPTTPRLIKSHLPVQFIPNSFWEQRSWIIYVARNTKDSAVSYFHFCRMNNSQPDPGDWNTFLQKFMEGKMVFGSWYDHVNGWWQKKQSYSNLHYMFYEDLIEDSGREIDRLCSFLGLSPSGEEKEKILAEVTFDSMKQNTMTNYSTVPAMNQKVSPFLRKGKAGDWKNHFTVSQNEQFDEEYWQKMKNPEPRFRFESNVQMKQMELPARPTLFDFHGVSMTKYFTDNWDNVQNIKARPDDIVIATYPKAGNTWVSYILDLLYFSQMTPARQDSVPLYERVPFLELAAIHGFPSGVDVINNLTASPRIIKTHLQVQFLPKSFWEQNSKIIYVARNAKDTAVSYFHFDRMNKAQPEPGDWNSYLQRFKEGKMVFGSWYEHMRGWWEKKQSDSNILFLFYEDLVENTERELSRLCSFLGLSATAELKSQVTEKVLFENMKNNKMANCSTDEYLDFSVSPFMRKGKVGDWKNHFTVQQDEDFNEDYEKKMKSTDPRFRTVL